MVERVQAVRVLPAQVRREAEVLALQQEVLAQERQRIHADQLGVSHFPLRAEQEAPVDTGGARLDLRRHDRQGRSAARGFEAIYPVEEVAVTLRAANRG